MAPDGIQPDIVVAIPEGTPPDQDPVLDRALQYLGTLDQQAASAPAPARARRRLVPMSVVGRVSPGWVVG